MNTENMNQNADPAAGQGTGEKTFSQEQVNAIVQKRLAEDREKASKELGEREQAVKGMQGRKTCRTGAGSGKACRAEHCEVDYTIRH